MTYIYIYIYISARSFTRSLACPLGKPFMFVTFTFPFVKHSKAPKGNGIGATGSKNLLAKENPCFSSARHGSKNLGLVLRPLCPYTVALRGVAYKQYSVF